MSITLTRNSHDVEIEGWRKAREVSVAMRWRVWMVGAAEN
jgi:hypothetical protein